MLRNARISMVLLLHNYCATARGESLVWTENPQMSTWLWGRLLIARQPGEEPRSSLVNGLTTGIPDVVSGGDVRLIFWK